MHECVRLLRPLALLLFLSPACGRGSAEPQGASVPASAPASAAAPPRAVIRGFVLAAPETIRLSPDLDSEHRMEPTVDYPSFEIARDSIGAITRRSVKPNQRTVRLSGGPARFKYLFAADSVDGWAFHVTVADTSECPDSRIEDALQAAGWAWADGYSADGTDGSVMGFVTKRFLCVVEGRWDGGDDSDSTYVPEPGCEVTVTCVPRRSDDVPKW